MCVRAHTCVSVVGEKPRPPAVSAPPLPAHGRVRGSAFVCGTLSLSLMAKLILASRQLECSKKKKKKKDDSWRGKKSLRASTRNVEIET